MNEFCLITNKLNYDYLSLNQSAIPATSATIPLYEKSFDKRSSINSIAFQYCNMKPFPNFVHTTKLKNKQTLIRRFLLTFICLIVVILAMGFIILLIVRFS